LFEIVEEEEGFEFANFEMEIEIVHDLKKSKIAALQRLEKK